MVDFWVDASYATEPASWAAAATYKSANRHKMVTSQVNGFPACPGMTERPSGRFPSEWLRPCSSFETKMPA